jgi:lysyl-tRNA synthetase class 2
MPTEKEKQLYAERLSKLKKLEAAGIPCYPAESRRTHTIAQALQAFDKLINNKTEIFLTGRIRAIRGHGKLVFGDLEDESGMVQFVVKLDMVGEQQMEVFKNFDIGDFAQFSGTMFLTKQGEKTLLVSALKLLTKSLRALPEKRHGLKDTETRLRRRYLELLSDPQTREIFRQKSRFWQSFREFLLQAGFMEVQMPVLERVPGGAEAEPFVTHHNALDEDFYLRVSLELPLKRLLVGVYEKVFEIGPIFRNEGIDAEHLQDYYQLEFYWAYAGFEDLKKILPKLYQYVIAATFPKDKTKLQEWSGEWEIYDYYELFKKYAGLNLSVCDVTDLKKAADKLGLVYEPQIGKGRLIDLIYKKTVREHLLKPGFLVYPPVEVEPLAKRLPQDPNRVQRLQIMAYGTELGKGFAELNDPLDQRQRFEEQMKLRAAGDKEAQMLDEDFVEALEYGMPPAAGFGVSERLFSKLVGKPVRETVIFPPMKRKNL